MKKTFIKKKYCSMLAGGTLTSMVTSALVMLDTVVAGLLLGEKAVAGINLMLPLYNLGSFFAMLLSLGIPILYTNAMGTFDHERAKKILGFSIISSVTIGILMSGATAVFKGHILDFYSAGKVVSGYAYSYCSWLPVLFLILPIQNLLFAMIFADGDESLTSIANITEILSKLIFSVLLVRYLGTAGITLGSVIGATLSTAVCLAHFFKKKNSLHPRLYFSRTLLADAVYYGLPDSCIWLFMALASAALCKYVTSAFGPDMLVLVSAINLMWELSLFFDGIGEAITPIMSIYCSEECYEGADRTWLLAKKTALAEGGILAVISIVFARYIPSLLGITDGTTAAYSVTGIRMIAITLPAAGFICILSAFYLVLGRIKLNLVLISLKYLILVLPLAFAGGAAFGINGMFAGIATAPLLTIPIMYIYVRSRYGRSAWPLLLEEKKEKVGSYLFEFPVLPEEITGTRDNIGKLLDERGFDKGQATRVMLLFEELFMFIYDKNQSNLVCAECAINIYPDKVVLIGRDDGMELDISDADMKIGSFRDFVLSSMISQRSIFSKHLIAMSFNRNMFMVFLEKKEHVG